MNESKKPLIVAAIPAFNEEKTIAKVVLLAQKHVDKVVVCDDGSTDMTGEIAKSLGADVIRHERNLGYGVAVQSLFKRARELNADVMVTLDGDGQHDPSEILMLVEPVLEGKADVAIGSRFLGDIGKKNSIPTYRRMGIKFITKLMGAAFDYGLSDAQSGFRVYGRKALESLSLCEDGMGVSVEVLMETKKRGLRVVEVPAGCNYHDLERTSTSSPLRHGASVVMSIIRLVVEEKPLTFLGLPGAIILAVGVLFGAFLLHVYTTERHIITNVALASIAFTFIGLFTIFTAITLYAVARVSQKMAKQQ